MTLKELETYYCGQTKELNSEIGELRYLIAVLKEACELGLNCALSLDDEKSQQDAEVIRAAIAKAKAKGE